MNTTAKQYLDDFFMSMAGSDLEWCLSFIVSLVGQLRSLGYKA
jgi:hypothetical protein